MLLGEGYGTEVLYKWEKVHAVRTKSSKSYRLTLRGSGWRASGNAPGGRGGGRAVGGRGGVAVRRREGVGAGGTARDHPHGVGTAHRHPAPRHVRHVGRSVPPDVIPGEPVAGKVPGVHATHPVGLVVVAPVGTVGVVIGVCAVMTLAHQVSPIGRQLF